MLLIFGANAQRMDSSTVKRPVERELQRQQQYVNYHGISLADIRSFLVDPFPVRTDTDDMETRPLDTWVVLQERGTPTEGYVIFFDPLENSWGVAEHAGNDLYTLVVSASSLNEARDGM